MIYKEEDFRKEKLVDIAKNMIIAARTAPKGRGTDNLDAVIITGNDIVKLSEELARLGEETGTHFYERDAHSVMQAECIVLFGCRYEPLGLGKNCQLCGFANCEEKTLQAPNTPCVFNTVDLGIAIGSACSTAMDFKVDTRVLFTGGVAAKNLNLLSDNISIAFAIPLQAKSKNPFFDRK